MIKVSDQVSAFHQWWMRNAYFYLLGFGKESLFGVWQRSSSFLNLGKKSQDMRPVKPKNFGFDRSQKLSIKNINLIAMFSLILFLSWAWCKSSCI